MSKENEVHELNGYNALLEKMYRLGYEDAKNKRAYGESIKQESNKYEYQGQKVEQLALF